MKKVISIILCMTIMFSMLTGCGNNIADTPEIESIPFVATESGGSLELEEQSYSEEEQTENNTSDTQEFVWEPEIKFTGISDESLLTYIEDTVYSQLITNLDGAEYYIEDVSAVYVSQEYLQELAYNSQSNIFFGYSLKELDSFFEGTRYVFTLGKDGETTVEPLQVVPDTTYKQILENVAVGTGVILLCVTVSTVTAGLGSAPAINMIFAVAAKSGAACALSGALISGVSSAVVQGYQTGDFSEALKAASLSASEGYKWGAISGSLSGAASETMGLYCATRTGSTVTNGLTMNQAALIQQESGYPLSIISQFHTFEEYTVFRDAGLQAEMLGGNLTLVRTDIDLYNVFDEYGRNNFTRMKNGLNPIDATGRPFEWHHIGQENDATLALLTATEHDANALHNFKVVTEIDRTAFNTLKSETLNPALLNWLLTCA